MTLTDDFKPACAPSTASVYRTWLDRGLPATALPAWLARAKEIRTHVGGFDEVRLSDCLNGCKVYRCSSLHRGAG